MNITAMIIELRTTDRSLSLEDIARKLKTTRDYVAQVIAKKRRQGVHIPPGTSTSKGHVGKFTFKLKRKRP
jgi:biotin operon repressor